MEVSGLLLEMHARIGKHVSGIASGLDQEALISPPEPGCNPIGWLLWHLTRVEDAHVAEILEVDQIWVEQDWGPRFGLESDPLNSGYGHSAADVGAVRPVDADAIVEHYRVVAERTRTLLESTTASDLDRIVDEGWDPPVTLGVRLVSIFDDAIQHAGQASYLKGLLERR